MPSLGSLCFLLAALFAAVARTTAGSFSYDNSSFLLDGKPYQIRGGQLDPQRVPKAYWSNRLAFARAMGLNTIFTYVFWDQVERSPGQFDWSGMNDVSEFFKQVQEAGLHAVLRAGPYIDGEHEWGGLPAWLSEVPGMAVRQNNQPFLDASKSYIDHLAKELDGSFVPQGGPILMVQLENEYGSCGADHAYTGALKDIFQAAFDVPLYTNDGGGQSYLEGGQVAGILAETDGGAKTGFEARNEYVNASSLGPQLDGEYYTTWLDTWGFNSTHETEASNTIGTNISTVISDVKFILSNQSSFSLYMFHGGTNWGFQNGALGGSALMACTSSYDYGAPLDESGHVTELYHSLRQTISDFISPNETLPAIPKANTLIDVPSFKLKPSVAMFDTLPAPTTKTYPVNMEALDQSTGFILYRTKVKSSVHGSLQPGDYPRDRVLAYVNGKRVGVLDFTYGNSSIVSLKLKKDDVLDLLIENLGRVDYGCPTMFDQRKGVVGNVTVGDTILKDWEIYTLPFEKPPSPKHSSGKPASPAGDSPPVFYTGSFKVRSVGDTFLELPQWIKGIVWVNGVNLGRYWIIGPQQSLYLPGCYLKKGWNDVTVLALEPNSADTARGVSNRTWGNNPDPDAP